MIQSDSILTGLNLLLSKNKKIAKKKKKKSAYGKYTIPIQIN